MTHQRAIEAIRQRLFKAGIGIDINVALVLAHEINAALAAEGFVVVPRERVAQHLAWLRVFIDESKPENWRDMQLRASRQLDDVEAMLSAATTGENDASK